MWAARQLSRTALSRENYGVPTEPPRVLLDQLGWEDSTADFCRIHLRNIDRTLAVEKSVNYLKIMSKASIRVCSFGYRKRGR